MKANLSPLNIIDIAVLNFEYSFIHTEKEIDLKRNFDNYELDIDFSLSSNGFIQVFIKSEINRGSKKMPGYSILAEIVCVFEFNKEIKITPEEKNSIEGFSTIYIALNSLRGIISQFTGNAPLGKYILPSIDLNKLIGQKKELLIKKLNKMKKEPVKDKKRR